MFYVVRGLTAIINRKHLENRKSYTKMNFQLLLATTEILSIPWADAWERGWKGSKVRRINRSPTILDCFQTSISTTVQCFLHILYYTHIVSDNSIRLVFFDFFIHITIFHSIDWFMYFVPITRLHSGIKRSSDNFPIDDSLYTEVVCFLTFNVCAMLGSLTTSFIQWVRFVISVFLNQFYGEIINEMDTKKQ